MSFLNNEFNKYTTAFTWSSKINLSSTSSTEEFIELFREAYGRNPSGLSELHKFLNEIGILQEQKIETPKITPKYKRGDFVVFADKNSHRRLMHIQDVVINESERRVLYRGWISQLKADRFKYLENNPLSKVFTDSHGGAYLENCKINTIITDPKEIAEFKSAHPYTKIFY